MIEHAGVQVGGEAGAAGLQLLAGVFRVAIDDQKPGSRLIRHAIFSETNTQFVDHLRNITDQPGHVLRLNIANTADAEALRV